MSDKQIGQIDMYDQRTRQLKVKAGDLKPEKKDHVTQIDDGLIFALCNFIK